METNNKWLSKDEIIIKFWNSKELELKMDAILYRHGVGRQTGILDDCRAHCFMELSRMDKTKIEELYNGKMNKTFEGYIIQMFKMVSIYTSNNNHKSSVVTNLKYGSSLDSNGHIDPTERGNNGDEDTVYNFIIEDKDLDYISQNENFAYIQSKLTDEEIDTLNLILDKKASKGRYKREVAEKVLKIKEEIKQYILENDKTYSYINPNKKEYKSDAEIENEIKRLNEN